MCPQDRDRDRDAFFVSPTTSISFSISMENLWRSSFSARKNHSPFILFRKSITLCFFLKKNQLNKLIKDNFSSTCIKIITLLNRVGNGECIPHLYLYLVVENCFPIPPPFSI